MAQSMKDRFHRAAALFYERLQEPDRQKLLQEFRSMDGNRDGRISKAELIQWARRNDHSGSSGSNLLVSAIPAVFAFVDTDGNGSLDFDECKGLFFILCTKPRYCDGCRKLLLESAYTCEECNVGNSFDLCARCYAAFTAPSARSGAGNPALQHPHSQMKAQESELADAIDDVLNQIQCDICKQYHRGNVEGASTKRHMELGVGPANMAICEWCRMDPCTTFYSHDFFKRLEKSLVFKECRTCNAKARDGTLLEMLHQNILTSTHSTRDSTPRSTLPFGGPSNDLDRIMEMAKLCVDVINAASTTINVLNIASSCSIM